MPFKCHTVLYMPDNQLNMEWGPLVAWPEWL